MKVHRVAVFSATVHWIEGVNTFFIRFFLFIWLQGWEGGRMVVLLRRSDQQVPFLRPVPYGNKGTLKIIITKSNKSNASALWVMRRSFIKRAFESGPIKGPCGIPIRSGVVPEISPLTRSHETHSLRNMSIYRKTASQRAKNFIFVKRNPCLTESITHVTASSQTNRLE